MRFEKPQRRIHDLKILPEYFEQVARRYKTFEVRKNDRNFKVGDLVELREWTEEKGYTGKGVIAEITYILDNKDYCKDGLIIFSINVFKHYEYGVTDNEQ